MAHKTLVGGTAYNISGGKSMVSGTVYNITGGKTLVGGTGYNIGFESGASSTLNDNDWNTISEISQSGQASNYWAVGDTKQIIVNGKVGGTRLSDLSVWVFILGFDHNSTYEGYNTIHFQIGKNAQVNGKDICLVDSQYSVVSPGIDYFIMYKDSPNNGGWKNSNIRGNILSSSSYSMMDPSSDTLAKALPSDLRSVMRRVTKYSDNTGGGSNTASYVTSTMDYLWLLSEYEVFGIRKYANSAEQNYQAQYTYYANGNSKIKYRHSESRTAYWWLRSVSATSASHFCRVNSSGSIDSTNANFSFGISPAFCV